MKEQTTINDVCFLGPSWQASWSPLEASRRPVRPSGSYLGRLGKIFRRLGALLDRLGFFFGPLGPLLARCTASVHPWRVRPRPARADRTPPIQIDRTGLSGEGFGEGESISHADEPQGVGGFWGLPRFGSLSGPAPSMLEAQRGRTRKRTTTQVSPNWESVSLGREGQCPRKVSWGTVRLAPDCNASARAGQSFYCSSALAH